MVLYGSENGHFDESIVVSQRSNQFIDSGQYRIEAQAKGLQVEANGEIKSKAGHYNNGVRGRRQKHYDQRYKISINCVLIKWIPSRREMLEIANIMDS